MKYDDILGTVGNTPVVRLQRMAPPGVEVFVKVESFNPMGSIKDRLALGIIEDAERKGTLKPGQTVIEATSGNTGIGLAMVCARKGYPLVVVMAENFSLERRKLLRFLGAQVVLTPASDRGTGMLDKAVELAEAHGWFLCRQFENEANADVHSETTAQEILADFEGERLDYWVTGFGTGGTLKGVARVLKEQRPETKVVVCEPDNSQIMGSGIRQPRHTDGSISAGHPSFRAHPMQGWSPDFIPKLAEDAQLGELVDVLQPISGDASFQCAKDLAAKEGILTGITAGATLAGALELAKSAPEGSRFLVMLPDTGERYLSTPLFEDVPVEMTSAEEEISRSTPNYRFDKPSAQATDDLVPTTPKAVDFVREAISDAENPVVMFSLEWCEFCWSVRKLFKKAGVAYRSVDLDSVENQVDDWGGKLRSALCESTGSRTVPQIFVQGEYQGGCTEVLAAWDEGSFQEKLRAAGVELKESPQLVAASLLPGWLHSR